MHAALLAPLAVDRIHRLTGLQCRHYLALARDDPRQHVGAHDRGHHRAGQQECRAAREDMARHEGCGGDIERHQDADQAVILVEQAADAVIDDPADQQVRHRKADRRARRHVEHILVDQERAGVEQVQHHQQRETAHPGRIRLPVEPVQVLRQRLGCGQVLLRVVEAAAVHGPQLAVDALLLQVRRGGLGQAVVQPHEIERRADPCDRGDDVHPPQLHIGPVEDIAFHVLSPVSLCHRVSCRGRSSTTRAKPGAARGSAH
ncbi:hypothetical protein D9M72_514360 [compost metagenome]